MIREGNERQNQQDLLRRAGEARGLGAEHVGEVECELGFRRLSDGADQVAEQRGTLKRVAQGLDQREGRRQLPLGDGVPNRGMKDELLGEGTGLSLLRSVLHLAEKLLCSGQIPLRQGVADTIEKPGFFTHLSVISPFSR